MAPTYGQFCPVAKAADVLCQRWTILIVRELLSGSTRFAEIQRGVPGCPPATLSKRLKELVAAGVVEKSGGSAGTYQLTEAGAELFPLVESFGRWGQRWARSSYPSEELDVEVLLWDVRRFLDPTGLGVERTVIELAVTMPDGGCRRFWVTVQPAGVDLCMVDPERPVDAVVSASLRELTRVWMGDTTFETALGAGTIRVAGPDSLVRRLPTWFGQHPILAPIGPAHPG